MAEESRVELAFPYPSEAVQRGADLLGMWLFLATEVMMFGAVIMALTVYRVIHAADMRAAAGHLHLGMGAANTALLLASSCVIALAVSAASAGRRREVLWELVGATLLGMAFLGIKMVEWFLDYRDGLMPGVSPHFILTQPAGRLFFDLYFLATGLHAVHLAIGIVLAGGLAVRVGRGGLHLPERSAVVEIVGLYWQFVDIVWIFLFPILYLASPYSRGRHEPHGIGRRAGLAVGAAGRRDRP